MTPGNVTDDPNDRRFATSEVMEYDFALAPKRRGESRKQWRQKSQVATGLAVVLGERQLILMRKLLH